MLIGPVALTPGNLLPAGVCFLVMPISYGNARNKTMSPNHLLKQSTEPCLLHALRSFGCVVSSQNSVSVQFILLHFMLTTLVPSKLQPTLSITNAPSTLRLTVTQSGKHMIIKLSPFHISPPLCRSQISSPNPCPVSAIISSLPNWCLSIYQHQFKGGCQRKYLYLHI